MLRRCFPGSGANAVCPNGRAPPGMRLLPRPWILPVLVVALVAAALQGARLHRVVLLSALPDWSVGAPAVDSTSPTGYAGGWRRLVVNDPAGQSQQWIAQTQQMLHEEHLQIPRVDYDNAPFGRENRSPGIYRLWLGGIAWLHAQLTGQPTGIAVEQAALYADLVLQAIGVALVAGFVWRQGGPLAASAVAIVLLTVFPFATQFVPGAPNSQSLAAWALLGSLLPLGLALRHPDSTTWPHWFLVAGFAGGIGLDLAFLLQASVLSGIMLGGVFLTAAIWSPSGKTIPPTPLFLVRTSGIWRRWGWGGALGSLAAYALDHYPQGLSLRLEANHPVYAIGWIAVAELLHQLHATALRRSWRLPRSAMAMLGLALVVAAAACGLVIWQRPPFLMGDLAATQLTRLNGGVSASQFLQWTREDGASLRWWATLLPVASLAIGVLAWLRLQKENPARVSVLFLCFPAVITLGAETVMLQVWNAVDAVGVTLLAVVLAGTSLRVSWPWLTGVGATALVGLICLIPPRATFQRDEFTPAEMQSLLERDLAHWLAQRQPGAVVLAPSALSTSLWYHGSLRVLTTFDPANRAGLLGALRIAASTSAPEARELLEGRQGVFLVLPEVDRGLDEAAHAMTEGSSRLFIDQLRDWILPAWLRPIAYYQPAIEGFPAKPVAVLEVRDEQTETAQWSQLATYFLESGMIGHASQLQPFLQRFPHEPGILVSLAEIARARQDATAWRDTLRTLDTVVASPEELSLSWERRLALATVLAQGGRLDAARAQAARCYAEADATRLRALTPKSLYRFVALGRTLQLPPIDSELNDLALRLLPPDFRKQASP